MENSTQNDKKLIDKYLIVPRQLETNETNAFISFAKYLEKNGIIFHLQNTNSNEDFGIIWKGFRNLLAHVSTIQTGKGIMAYELKDYWPTKSNKSATIEEVLEEIKASSNKFPSFFYDSQRKAWIMNVDSLVSILCDIKKIIFVEVDNSKLTNSQLKTLVNLINPS